MATQKISQFAYVSALSGTELVPLAVYNSTTSEWANRSTSIDSIVAAANASCTITSYGAQITQLTRSLSDMQSEYNTLKSQFNTLQSEVESSQEENSESSETVTANINSIVKSLNNQYSYLNQLGVNVAHLEADNIAQDKQISANTESITNLIKENIAQSSSIKGLHELHDELVSYIKDPDGVVDKLDQLTTYTYSRALDLEVFKNDTNYTLRSYDSYRKEIASYIWGPISIEKIGEGEYQEVHSYNGFVYETNKHLETIDNTLQELRDLSTDNNIYFNGELANVMTYIYGDLDEETNQRNGGINKTLNDLITRVDDEVIGETSYSIKDVQTYVDDVKVYADEINQSLEDTKSDLSETKEQLELSYAYTADYISNSNTYSSEFTTAVLNKLDSYIGATSYSIENVQQYSDAVLAYAEAGIGSVEEHSISTYTYASNIGNDLDSLRDIVNDAIGGSDKSIESTYAYADSLGHQLDEHITAYETAVANLQSNIDANKEVTDSAYSYATESIAKVEQDAADAYTYASNIGNKFDSAYSYSLSSYAYVLTYAKAIGNALDSAYETTNARLSSYIGLTSYSIENVQDYADHIYNDISGVKQDVNELNAKAVALQNKIDNAIANISANTNAIAATNKNVESNKADITNLQDIVGARKKSNTQTDPRPDYLYETSDDQFDAIDDEGNPIAYEDVKTLIQEINVLKQQVAHLSDHDSDLDGVTWGAWETGTITSVGIHDCSAKKYKTRRYFFS